MQLSSHDNWFIFYFYNTDGVDQFNLNLNFCIVCIYFFYPKKAIFESLFLKNWFSDYILKN